MFAGVIMAGVSTLELGIAAFFLYRTRRFLDTAVDAPGTVVELSASSGGEGGTVYHPVVSFQTAEGQVHTFTDKLGSNPPRHQPGDPVPVKYDPVRPAKARINKPFRLYFVPGLLAVIGLPILIGGLVMIAVGG